MQNKIYTGIRNPQPKPNTFLQILLAEKNLMNTKIYISGPAGILVSELISIIESGDQQEKALIENALHHIDRRNGNILSYLKYIAAGILARIQTNPNNEGSNENAARFTIYLNELPSW